MGVSLQRIARSLLAAAVVASVIGPPGSAALAVPSASQTAADQAAVSAAVAKLQAAQARSASIDARTSAAVANLDSIVARQHVAQQDLDTRVGGLYRSGGSDFLLVLLGATSFPDFASRWDLLVRLGEQSAKDIAELNIARTEAQRSAAQLIALQSQQAQAADELAREAARAREQFASDQAALAAYEARTAALAAASAKNARPSAPAPAPAGPSQQQHGTGGWQQAVASNYDANFHGRGASGKEIGPYSMMVAHKTLPFGTLVEIQYNGKRCVASVEDRGPFTPGRDFDLGPGVVRALGFEGVHSILWRVVGR